jgi:hypothetical protein
MALRRPLLDGFAPPPPYRWVSPPPTLAEGNESPAPATASVEVAAGQSQPATISTPDLQASLFLVAGAFDLPGGATSVKVDVEPRAPDPQARLPDGLELAGNAYVFAARAVPGEQALVQLQREATVVLVYPAPASVGHAEALMLRSADGLTWVRVRTTSAELQHQAAANVRRLGLFAVGTRRQPSAGGGISQSLRITIFVLLLAAAAAAAVLGWRRRRPPRKAP